MARKKSPFSGLLLDHILGKNRGGNKKGAGKKWAGKGIIGLIAVALLFLIGLVNPGLRDQMEGVLHLLNDHLPAAHSPEDDIPLSSKVKGTLTEGIWTVVNVVDGDTLVVGDHNDKKAQYRVRLIGADTPETVKPNTPVQPFGQEASAFTKQKIAESQNRVRLAFDGDELDRYGRSLAMVYLQMPEGEVWLNELLLREGLARALLQYRFSKGAKNALQQAETEAQTAQKGLWSVR